MRVIEEWGDRFRTRIPSIRGFLARAAADRRNLIYDLLPLFSTPRARNKVRRLFAAVRPKTAGFSPSASALAWTDRLVTDGIMPSLPPVSEPMISEMRTYFEATPCVDPYRAHLGEFRFDQPASPDTNMGYYGVAQILAAPHVLGLFNDPQILETAERYLGCKPLLDNIGAWWSYPGRTAAKGTQRYHRDFDSFGGFKLFIYLTDVDAEAGPHVFMKGSHRSPLLDTGRACPDELVYRWFGEENETTVMGPAGTRFIADTFGFHKGLLPTCGRRLLVSAQYNVNASPHIPRERPDAFVGGFDPEINSLILADKAR